MPLAYTYIMEESNSTLNEVEESPGSVEQTEEQTAIDTIAQNIRETEVAPLQNQIASMQKELKLLKQYIAGLNTQNPADSYNDYLREEKLHYLPKGGI